MPATDFRSVLFLGDQDPSSQDNLAPPAHFHDLNLDQLVESICIGQPGTDLQRYFWTPLPDVESVRYRQGAFRETERAEVRALVTEFTAKFQRVRLGQAQLRELRYRLQRQRCLLDNTGLYCDAVTRLAEGLAVMELTSAAYRGLRRTLLDHVRSPEFTALREDQARVTAALDDVTYTLWIHRNRIGIDVYSGQDDLGAYVADLFSRFAGGGEAGQATRRPYNSGVGHVEAQVLTDVAELFPAPFRQLEEFWTAHREFIDIAVARFGHEAHFLLAWVAFIERLAASGLQTCYPMLSNDKPFSAHDSYDMALAVHQLDRKQSLVTNDICLGQGERIVVVTGPNQGGKTTFARMLGQVNYLAALGCPVPGRQVCTALADEVFVHFEREEAPDSSRGKLLDDLLRMRDILDRATPASLIILNELFSSTSSDDALDLAQRIMARVVELGCLCVCVTFLDELSTFGPTVVSMVSEVDPDDPGVRTYIVNRRPADGHAYAAAIAQKYGLSPEAIARRTQP